MTAWIFESYLRIVFNYFTQSGITCKKILCFMLDSACRCQIFKKLKYFKVMVNIFESPTFMVPESHHFIFIIFLRNFFFFFKLGMKNNNDNKNLKNLNKIKEYKKKQNFFLWSRAAITTVKCRGFFCFFVFCMFWHLSHMLYCLLLLYKVS